MDKEKILSLLRSNRKTVTIILVVLFVIGIFWVSKKTGNKPSTSVGSSQTVVDKNTPTVSIGKSFEFLAIDADKETNPVTYTIVQAERKSEVKVKGESRTPAADNDFLLLRLEIDNKQSERVAFSSSDHIRLSMTDKRYSPDFHNGNIVVDPISVKKDLVAFVVPKKEKTFKFFIGELEGDKQELEITF